MNDGADVGLNLTGGSLRGLQQWSGDIYYFTIDFTGTPIHPGDWNICEKEAVAQISSPIQGGYSNDWSYQELTGNPDYDCKTFNGLTAYIPVYDSGEFLWGEEPPGGSSTAAPTGTPVSTATPTPVSTATPGQWGHWVMSTQAAQWIVLMPSLLPNIMSD